MNTNGNMRVHFDKRLHHGGKHNVVGILPGSSTHLDDYGCITCVGGGHDSEGLLHVIDVERGHTVTVLRCVIEKLPQSDTRHRADLRVPARVVSADNAGHVGIAGNSYGIVS